MIWVKMNCMSKRPFPKPSPAEPLPEEVWLKRTDRAEAGREPFFYGRDDEYEVFQGAANSLRSGIVGGGTMVFQGAPGAGKSALMQECMEAVRRQSTPDDPWVAVSVNPGTLRSSINVVMDLTDAANTESKRLSKIASDAIAVNYGKLLELGSKLYKELSDRGVGAAGFSVGGKSQTVNSPDATMSSGAVFRNAASLLEKFHIVVFVDEAQNTPVADTTQDVLDCLHRASQGIPLVVAFFGLSDSEQVLRECGLSRFAANRVVNLEPLSMEDATGSFQRLLDAYYTGTEEDVTQWANALAELSQGWPQHINQVGVAAGQVIRANKGRLERHLLSQSLDKGTERKNDYYAGRVKAGSSRAWVYKRLALAAVKKQGEFVNTLSYDEIDLLTESARKRKDESIEEFLTNALHAGLLSPARGMLDHYKIPIPSLGDYLRALPVEPPQAV